MTETTESFFRAFNEIRFYEEASRLARAENSETLAIRAFLKATESLRVVIDLAEATDLPAEIVGSYIREATALVTAVKASAELFETERQIATLEAALATVAAREAFGLPEVSA